MPFLSQRQSTETLVDYIEVISNFNAHMTPDTDDTWHTWHWHGVTSLLHSCTVL